MGDTPGPHRGHTVAPSLARPITFGDTTGTTGYAASSWAGQKACSSQSAGFHKAVKAEPICRRPRTRQAEAFTLIDLLLVFTCLALVAAALLPMLTRSRVRSSKIGCANNMKQTALGFRTWAIDNDEHFPMQVSVTNEGSMELVASGVVFPHFQVMSNELSTPKILACPNDKRRTYATNFTSGLTDKNISYFLNVDSCPGDGSSLLCGDRNLTNVPSPGSRFVSVRDGLAIGWTKEVHSRKGILSFADGRVEGVANGGPDTMVSMKSGITNRLAMP
jgi:type II secretory pathway pseudopilin PulG